MAVAEEPTSGPNDGPNSVKAPDPLEAAAAAGPLVWPEDPEGDPTDTPVVVMGTDDEDRSTYEPFPDTGL